MEDSTLLHINKAWEGACRVFFGKSIGEIGKYEKYLQKFVTPYGTSKSVISREEVTVTGNYAKGSRFIAGDEIQRYGEIIGKAKLDINEIKDIDSIISALSEHICYSGSDVLGNSSFVAHSNRVVDSSFIYKAHDVFYSKYVAYAYLAKYSEYIFGSESVGKGTHFVAKGFETYESSRIFECVHAYHSFDLTYCANLENCSDCYFCHNCENLVECMFCFNAKGKRYAIGNKEIGREAYMKLKKLVQAQIRRELSASKSLKYDIYSIGAMGR